MYARIITVFVLIAFGMTAAMLVLTYPADAIVWVPILLVVTIVATVFFLAVRGSASRKARHRPVSASLASDDVNNALSQLDVSNLPAQLDLGNPMSRQHPISIHGDSLRW